MKIWYENTRPVDDPENQTFLKRLRKNFNKYKNPDTEFVLRSPSKGIKEMKYIMPADPYYQHLRDPEMVEGFVQAEKEGYDAAIAGCYGDPGLEVGRAILNIPVIGVGESSRVVFKYLGATLIGVIGLPFRGVLMHKVGQSFAKEGFVAIQKSFTLSEKEIEDVCEGEADPAKFIDDFKARAREAIKEGAQALVGAATMASVLLTAEGITEVDGVPVVDCTVAALKMAETIVDMRNKGLWKVPKHIPDEVIEALRKVHYHGSKSV